MEVKAGDLIYSGTPAGVGPLVPGDICVVEIEGLGKLTTTISERSA
jgi:fumarylpyruvate hydrolase